MCLGIPGRVVEPPSEVNGLLHARVEFEGVRRPVCLACVPEAVPGDYVIVHAGIAISRIDPVEAERLLQHLRNLNDTDNWTEAGNEVSR